MATHDQNHGGKGLGWAAAGLPVIFLGGKKAKSSHMSLASKQVMKNQTGVRVGRGLEGKVLARTALCQVLMQAS